MKKLLLTVLCIAFTSINAQSKKDFALLTNAEWVNKNLDYLRFDQGLVISNLNNTKHRLEFDVKNQKIFFKVNYRVGTRVKTEKIEFRIKQLEKNKLVIVPKIASTKLKTKKLNAVSFLNKKQYVFYNRGQLISKIKFKKVTFHASTCFGTCTSLSVEIDNKGNVYYQGRRYAKKFTGNFIGKLSKSELYQFRKILNRSQLRVLDQKWKQKTKPTDSPRYNYIVELSNGRLLEMNTNDQHPILDKLSEFLINIPEVADLKRIRKKHKFESSHTEIYRVSAN